MDSWPEKLKIADSHAHLDVEEFSQDREDVVRRAWEGGVHGLLYPAEMTTPQSLPIVLGLSERYPWVAAAAGVHLRQAKELLPSHLDGVKELAIRGKIRAVGEIGLDYRYNTPRSSARSRGKPRWTGFSLRPTRPILSPLLSGGRQKGMNLLLSSKQPARSPA